jgi:hypothetical protein
MGLYGHKSEMTEQRGRNAARGTSRWSNEPSQQPAGEWRLWLLERIRGLPWSPRARDSDIPLGTRVLVLKGDTRNDLGQMAIVSRRAGSQVEISYRDPTGAWRTRRKLPSSLIRMQEGIELVVDGGGVARIQRMAESSEAESDIGRVSDDEDEEVPAQ